MRAMFLALFLVACDREQAFSHVYTTDKDCVPSQGYEVYVPTAAGTEVLSPWFGIVDDPGDALLDMEVCDADGCELEPVQVRYQDARGPGYPGVYSVQCGYREGLTLRLTFARVTDPA